MNEKSRKTRFRWEGAQYIRALGGVNRPSSFSDELRGSCDERLVCRRLPMIRCKMAVLSLRCRSGDAMGCDGRSSAQL